MHCCQCVRKPPEIADEASSGSRPPVASWKKIDEEDSDGDALTKLPLPSWLLAPTSKISMEPMAVRDDRSWPYVTKPALRPPLARFPALGTSDLNTTTPWSTCEVSAISQLPLASVQLPVDRGSAPNPEREARQLLRTMLSPGKQRIIGSSVSSTMGVSLAAAPGSRVASASQLRSASPPVASASAAPRSGSVPLKRAANPGASVTVMPAETLRVVKQASSSLPKAAVVLDADGAGRMDYSYAGYDGNRNSAGVPDALLKTVYLPKELHGGRVLVEETTNKWRATNQHIEGQPGGLRYRGSKSLEDLVDGIDEGVAFGEVFHGFDEGDDWVRVELALQVPFVQQIQSALDAQKLQVAQKVVKGMLQTNQIVPGTLMTRAPSTDRLTRPAAAIGVTSHFIGTPAQKPRSLPPAVACSATQVARPLPMLLR